MILSAFMRIDPRIGMLVCLVIVCLMEEVPV
jgi:hypothetical protein